MPQSSSVRRFASEGVVIVLSILIAFWIDAWWDDRQEAEQEAALLDALAMEAAGNRAEMDLFFRRTELDLDRADRFFRSDAEALFDLPPDSTGLWLRATLVPWTFDPDLTAAAVLLSRPFPSSRRASEVRPAVAEWVRLVEDAEEEKVTLTGRGNALLAHLAAATTETVSEGLAPLDQMASRLGPPLLSRLRNDRTYMGGVAEKTHQQGLYLDELKAASILLDSLIVQLADIGG